MSLRVRARTAGAPVLARSSTCTGCAGVGQLHQIRAGVADLLHRDQRRVPVDRARPRHEVRVIAPAVVVHVRRDDVLRGRSRSRRPRRPSGGRGRNRSRCRRAVRRDLAFEHRRQGGGVRQLVRDHLHGDAHAARSGQIADLLEAADRRRPMIVARDLSGCWGSEVHHQHIERNPLRELSALSVSRTAASRRSRSFTAFEKVGDH